MDSRFNRIIIRHNKKVFVVESGVRGKFFSGELSELGDIFNGMVGERVHFNPDLIELLFDYQNELKLSWNFESRPNIWEISNGKYKGKGSSLQKALDDISDNFRKSLE